jgi:hypothetical protein
MKLGVSATSAKTPEPRWLEDRSVTHFATQQADYKSAAG